MLVLAQIPEPKPGQDPWSWVALLVATVSFIAIGWLGNKLYDILVKRGDEWKARAETCLDVSSKTADALKTANDATERLARVVTDGGTRVDGKLEINNQGIADGNRKLDRLLDLFLDRERRAT